MSFSEWLRSEETLFLHGCCVFYFRCFCAANSAVIKSADNSKIRRVMKRAPSQDADWLSEHVWDRAWFQLPNRCRMKKLSQPLLKPDLKQDGGRWPRLWTSVMDTACLLKQQVICLFLSTFSTLASTISISLDETSAGQFIHSVAPQMLDIGVYFLA